jgi:very-short-patch-repair endonuclease
MPRNEAIVCAVPHGLHIPRDRNVILRQTTSIEAIDVVVHSSGLRIASPPRLGFDLSRDLSAEDHASLIEQMIERQMCTAGVLAMVGRRLTHPARRGSHRFVRTMMERHVGAPHESHPEMLLAAALKARGIPVVAQHPLYGVPGVGDIRFDLAVVEHKWAVEIDVHPSHVLLDGTTKDKRRDRACHRLGWQVERITAFDLLDLEGAADELLESYNIRVRSAA